MPRSKRNFVVNNTFPFPFPIMTLAATSVDYSVDVHSFLLTVDDFDRILPAVTVMEEFRSLFKTSGHEIFNTFLEYVRRHRT